MASSNRPLSPHTTIYRWQLHMVLSILHRATGVALGVGMLMLAGWLMATAAGADGYKAYQAFLGTILGRLIMLGFVFSLMLHLANGVRHLFWDVGMGFGLDATRRSNLLVLGSAMVLTVVTFLAGYGYL